MWCVGSLSEGVLWYRNLAALDASWRCKTSCSCDYQVYTHWPQDWSREVLSCILRWAQSYISSLKVIWLVALDPGLKPIHHLCDKANQRHITNIRSCRLLQTLKETPVFSRLRQDTALIGHPDSRKAAIPPTKIPQVRLSCRCRSRIWGVLECWQRQAGAAREKRSESCENRVTAQISVS